MEHGVTDNYNAEDHTEFLTIEGSELEEVQSLSAKRAVRVQILSQSGFEPVASVTVILLGTVAAVTSVIQAVEHFRGGQVIDLRDQAIANVYRTREVVYGMTVVITADGKVVVRFRNPDKTFQEALSALPPLLAAAKEKTATEVAKTLESTAGDAADIDTTANPESTDD